MSVFNLAQKRSFPPLCSVDYFWTFNFYIKAFSNEMPPKMPASASVDYFWTFNFYIKAISNEMPPKTHIFESPASTSWPSSSGLRSRRRTCLTILKRAWSADSKMVR
jgi:hypothetical protein